jgi:N-sulfoglucosamine sulfohydrolase
MTGRYPHNSGAIGFNKILPGVPTLPETLGAHGYVTGILGKTKHVVPSRKSGFDYVRGAHLMADGRSADRYAEFSGEFFNRVRRSHKPFFLMVNSHDPHRPFDNRKPVADREVTLDTGRRKRGSRGDPPAPSRIYRPEEIPVPGFLPDLPAIREEMAGYYSSVRRADDTVGAVLKALDESGFAANTLVMLKSDHGIEMPFAKGNVWRSSTLSPWIVRWPGVIEPESHDTTHLVGGIDFAPTILDAVGLEALDGMEGRSLLPILRGEKQDGREYVYTYFYVNSRNRPYAMRSIQDARYGYIWNGWSDGRSAFENAAQRGATMKAVREAAKADPRIAARVTHHLYRVPEEFYDYEKDPDALNNLIDDPAMRERIDAFRIRLLEHMERTGDPERERFEPVARP